MRADILGQPQERQTARRRDRVQNLRSVETNVLSEKRNSVMDLQVNTHTCTQLEDDESESEIEDDARTHAWGRLVPVAAGTADSHDLRPKGIPELGQDADVHVIGRNVKCDFVLQDVRVSGYHCRIYRRWDRGPASSDKVATFVEDTSSNGTFVNKIKLAKRERRPLANGDELALVSPRKDVNRTAAFVYINIDNPSSTSVGRHSDRQQLLPALPFKDVDVQRSIEHDYDLREELGSGAIGKVFKAVERSTGRCWAAKIVMSRQLAQNGCLCADSVLQEAKILRTISHPAIVKVHEVYCTKTAFSIVMQLVEGGDLFDRISKRCVYPENEACGVLQHLLSALAYLHDRGIAHRDIKPENILLRTHESNVDVLLTDFGLAKFAAVGSEGCRTFCGTPQYLAPEVLKQRDHDTGCYDGAAADIWSVGVVLFVLLSGMQPSRSDWFLDSHWTKVSREARDVLRQLTIVEASKRPSANLILTMPWLASEVAQSTDCVPDADTQVKRQRLAYDFS